MHFQIRLQRSLALTLYYISDTLVLHICLPFIFCHMCVATMGFYFPGSLSLWALFLFDNIYFLDACLH
jgi:hypothetical protein